MSETPAAQSAINFRDLALSKPVLAAVESLGYETPSPIQSEMIPHLQSGADVIGQAQTGTGKTAAFALPLLSNIDLSQKEPQVLVLAPTRELAIQVAEAFQRYAHKIKGFHVLPIYGGQDYGIQLRHLKRNPQVIVGTPGRVMDHMRKKTLKLSQLRTLVLDEADEMLRMGFVEDVEWILEQTHEDRQIALFSATMPHAIRKIAEQHLQEPITVTIKEKTATAKTIRQRFWMTNFQHKMETLTRVLEVEQTDGVIVFVRTKTLTIDLAERLEARGYGAAALNGDIAQKSREKIVEKFKKGKIDILVATDVAARGLDVERVSHVVNYDIPHDTESYIHRIGRTGRAGRTGEAILFITPREKRMLQSIERATKQKIEHFKMPSISELNDQRIQQFKEKILETVAAERRLEFYRQLLSEIAEENDLPEVDLGAALAVMREEKNPLLLQELQSSQKRGRADRNSRNDRRDAKDKNRREGQNERRRDRNDHDQRGGGEEIEKETFRLEVGKEHGVEVRNIVGAIANEAGLDNAHIGRVRIFDEHSTIDLPVGMPNWLLKDLKKVWLCDHQLEISRIEKSEGKSGGYRKDRKPKRFADQRNSERRDDRKNNASKKSGKSKKFGGQNKGKSDGKKRFGKQ